MSTYIGGIDIGEAHTERLHANHLFQDIVIRDTAPAEALYGHFEDLHEPDVLTYWSVTPRLRGRRLVPEPRLHLISDPDIAKTLLNEDPSVIDKLGPPTNGPFSTDKLFHTNGEPGLLFSPTNDHWKSGRDAASSSVWGELLAKPFGERYGSGLIDLFTSTEHGKRIKDVYEFIAPTVVASGLSQLLDVDVTPDQTTPFVQAEALLTEEFTSMAQAIGFGSTVLSRNARATRRSFEDGIQELVTQSNSPFLNDLKNAGASSRDQANHVSEMSLGFMSAARAATFAIAELARISDVSAIDTRGFAKEVTRYYPAVPLLPRSRTSRLHLGDVFVVSTLNMGRSKRIWGENANEFDEHRFDDQDPHRDALLQRIVFGQGLRKCIGMHVGRRIVETTVDIARGYDIQIETPVIKFARSITLKANPIPAEISPKSGT